MATIPFQRNRPFPPEFLFDQPPCLIDANDLVSGDAHDGAEGPGARKSTLAYWTQYRPLHRSGHTKRAWASQSGSPAHRSWRVGHNNCTQQNRQLPGSIAQIIDSRCLSRRKTLGPSAPRQPIYATLCRPKIVTCRHISGV